MDLPYTLDELREVDQRADHPQQIFRAVTSARSPTAPTARWGSTRSTTRSMSRSPCGSGAPTSARRASPRASARAFPRGGGSRPDSLIPHAKASGQYLNSVLAKIEASKSGYQEAIMLDRQGSRLRGQRREHLHRPRRGDRDSRSHLEHPRRDQPPLDHADRRRSRLRGRRARRRARRADARR